MAVIRVPSVLAFLACWWIPSLNSQQPEYKLEFVTTVFRHGDRTPVTAFPNSEYQESYWPQGFGQLTQKGMREGYHLGEIYNDLYVKTGFLNKNYTRVQVYIRSTDYDRTLMTGLSMLAGLYPPEEQEQFDPDIPWQPIPIHTVPQQNDTLLRGRQLYCPEYQRLMELDKTTKEYLQLEEDNKDLFEKVSRETGGAYDLSNIWEIGDELFIERTHDLPMPPWYTDELLADIKPLQDYGIYLMFNSEVKQKITGGIWANEVITSMLKKADSSDDLKDLKAIFYSAHDTTVAAMQSVFQMYDGVQTPYTGSFNIELYSTNNEYFVKFRYRNDTFSDELHDLVHPGCSQDPCPLNELAEAMKPFMLTVEDRAELCEIKNASSNTSSNKLIVGLITVVCVCGFILVVTVITMAIILLLAIRQRNRINKYKQLTTTEDT